MTAKVRRSISALRIRRRLSAVDSISEMPEAPKSDRRPVLWPLLLLAAGMLAIRVLVAAVFPPLYEEAYFAEWAKFPAFGYPDHPPMIAWLMSITGRLFPTGGPLALRAGSLICGAAAMAGFALTSVRVLGRGRPAMWSVAMFLCLPLVIMTGILAAPAAVLLLFNVLFLGLFWRAVERGKTVDWMLCGVALGLALLSGWQALLSAVAAGWFFVRHRREIGTTGQARSGTQDTAAQARVGSRAGRALLAAGVAFAIFSPFLLWNAAHGWISFKFALWDKHWAAFAWAPWRAAEYLGEQVIGAGLFFTVPLFACLWVKPESLRPRWRQRFIFLKLQAAVVIVWFFVLSLFVQTHPHWTLVAYPPLIMMAAIVFADQPERWFVRRLPLAVYLTAGSMMLIGISIGLGLAALKRMDPQVFGPVLGRKVAMSRERLFGWPKLAARLDADLKRHFPKGDARLFTHNPELSSLVSYHKGGPVVINLAALTSRRFVRGLSQQQYVPREDLRGASGIYYGHDVDAAGHGLHHKFAEVKELPPIDIRHDGKLIMRYRVFLVRELK